MADPRTYELTERWKFPLERGEVVDQPPFQVIFEDPFQRVFKRQVRKS